MKFLKIPDFIRSLWPDTETEKGMGDAIKAGALSILYLAMIYAVRAIRIGAAFAIADEETLGIIQEHFSLTGNLVLSAGGIVPALVLAWLVWKRHSLAAMWIGVVWLVGDLGARFLFAPATPARLLIAGLIALACSLHGLRGVYAAKRRLSGRPVEA